MHALTIVCPVDYSDCSKRALRYAGALTDHFGARLVVLHVFDPLLASAAQLHQFQLLGEDGQRELAVFVEEHLSRELRRSSRLEQVLTVGAAGSQIVELATRRAADLVVMGTHGFSGVRKAFFGSTLQAVLRTIRIPVLAVPLVDHRQAAIRAPLIAAGPVLAPVDFSPESEAAARAAAGLAGALHVPLALLHVVEPAARVARGWQYAAAAGDRTAVQDPAMRMSELAESIGPGSDVVTYILHGDPAEIIARQAREKHAALIVMSLGSSARGGRPPGSIAYRVLCLAPVPVLAIAETAAGHAYVAHLHQQAGAVDAR